MAEDNYSLVVEVALNNSSFQDGMKNLNRTIRGATAEFKNSVAGLDGYGKGLDGLRAKSDMLSKQVDAQSKIVQMNKDKFNESKSTLDETAKTQEGLKAKIDEVTKAYEDSIKTTGENSEETKGLKAELDKLSTEYTNNEEKIRNNVRTMENWETKVNNSEAKLKGMEKSLQSTNTEIEKQSSSWYKLSQTLEETGEKMQSAGKKIEGAGKDLSKKLTLPLVGVATASAKLGIDFERGMSKIQSVTGATAEEMEVLEKSARQAGSTTDKSASDAADALYQMGLAGWDVSESQSALLPMLKLSSTANMDLGTTTNMVVAGLNTMGMEVEDTGRYLDVLAQTSRNSATDIDQLGEAFQTVGGRLSMLGVEVEEGAVALGLMADAGIVGSEAGRGLNAVLTNLTAPTGRAKEALDELNISAFDTNGEFIGIEETLLLVESALEGMTQEQQNTYLSMISGKEHAKSLDALMKGLGGSFGELADDVAGADGALDEMYDTVTGDTMGAITNLKSALEEAGLVIYENLQPTIEQLTEFLQGLTDKFNSLSPETQENIVKIGALVAAIGPVLVVGGKLIDVVGKTAERFGKLIPIISKTGTFIMGLQPQILIAVAAIGGLIAIGVSLYKNWDTVKAKAGELKESISNTFSSLATSAKSWGSDIVSGLWEGIKGAGSWLKGKINGFVENVKGFFTKPFGIKSPSTVFYEYGGNLMEGLGDGIEDSLDIVEEAMDLATKTINEAGIDEGIKRLSISTDDLNEQLLNQTAIVEIQKRRIEQLSREHEKLANSTEATTEEIDKSKKALERAKTELLRYERAVDETTSKIVENFRKQREEVEKSQIDAINDLTSRIKSALKKRYEEEYRAKEKAINREIDSLDRWKNESLERINAVYDARKKRNDEELAELDRWRNRNIDSINAVYDTKMQRITETANAQIKALQDEIKALDKAEQQKSREEEDAERQRRIGRLREAIKYEHNEFNKAELQKELNKEIKDRDEQLRQWQVEDRKEKLNQQIADIRESAEHEKAILEQRRNEELERTNSIYEHKRATLEKEREMLNIRQKEELTRINELYEYERETLDRKLENYRAFLNRRTEDAKLQAEAEKMIMDNNQKEIVKLLHSYEDSYKRAGQSLGERLVEGFKPAIDQIIDMIDSINGRLGSAKASAGRSVNSIGAMASDGGDSGAKSQSVGSPQGGPVGSVWNDDGSLKGYMWKDGTITAPDGSGTVVNNNVTINSPKALSHSDIKRETETTLRRLSFSV